MILNIGFVRSPRFKDSLLYMVTNSPRYSQPAIMQQYLPRDTQVYRSHSCQLASNSVPRTSVSHVLDHTATSAVSGCDLSLSLTFCSAGTESGFLPLVHHVHNTQLASFPGRMWRGNEAKYPICTLNSYSIEATKCIDYQASKFQELLCNCIVAKFLSDVVGMLMFI